MCVCLRIEPVILKFSISNRCVDVFRCNVVVEVYVTDVGWSSVISRRVKFLWAALSTVWGLTEGCELSPGAEHLLYERQKLWAAGKHRGSPLSPTSPSLRCFLLADNQRERENDRERERTIERALSTVSVKRDIALRSWSLKICLISSWSLTWNDFDVSLWQHEIHMTSNRDMKHLTRHELRVFRFSELNISSYVFR